MIAIFAAAAAAAQQPSLAIFEPFVGACFVADFTPTMHDTHCFTPMFGGAHVRDAHEVRENGKVIYAGETIYSRDGGDLVFIYVNSTGGVGRGTLTGDDRTFHFSGTMRGSPDKAPTRIDSDWWLVDADHYEVRSLVPTPSGGFEKPIRFTRIARED
jgi:hypothetical protein